MSKIAQRLLIFFIGVPLILGIVCLSQFNHLLLHIVIFLAVGLAVVEMCNLLKTKGTVPNQYFLMVLCLLVNLTSYLCALFNLSSTLIYVAFITSASILLGKEVLFPINKGEDNFSGSIHSLTSGIFVLFYCGLFPTFISQISTLENSVFYLSLYFLIVFCCDSVAWLFGVTMGKNNKGFVKVSPNKSIMGFIGGLVGAVVVSFLTKLVCSYVAPDLFLQPGWKIALFAIIVAVFAILGDLVESLIKRSADCKDSGHVIMGRGGILDSIDSLLFAAPAFYMLANIFFN